LDIESLRSCSSMSFASRTTLMLNRSLGGGLCTPCTTPLTTSVGPGTAFSSTKRDVLADSRGMFAPTRLAGSRLKYGRP